MGAGVAPAGRLDEADQAAQRYREHCQDTPGPGEVITSSMFGHVAKSRGQVRTAARWFRQVLAADTGGWEFTVLCDLPGVLGMAGETTSARQALMELMAARNPGYAFLEPEVILGGAWVAAAEGGVSEAVALARQAAELAASQHQPAVAVFALHTAVCFGDPTVAGQLAELVTQVDGPRAPAAARTPPPWPLTMAQRCTPRRCISNRWVPCYSRPTPPPRPPPHTPVMASAARPKPRPPAPTD